MKCKILMSTCLLALFFSACGKQPYPPAPKAKFVITPTSEDTSFGTVSGGGICVIGESITINVSPKSDFRFIGWYEGDQLISSNASYTYTNVQSDHDPVARFSGEFNIKVTKNIEEAGSVDGDGPSWGRDNVTLSASTNYGYTFLGWYDDKDTLVTDNPFYSFKMPNKDVNLTAKWKANSFIVTVKCEHEEQGNVTGGGTYEFGKLATVLATPNNGYAFEGWYNGSMKIQSGPELKFQVTEDIDLVARFDIINYQITYNLNGGTNHPDNPDEYNVLSDFDLLNPTRKNHTFINWTDQNGHIVTRISKGSWGKLILNANWKINSFKVTVEFDKTRGEAIGGGVYDYGSIAEVDATSDKSGFTFAGWYNGKIKVTSMRKLSFVVTEDITLTAHFDPIKYKITYNLNGGINNPKNPEYYTTLDEITLLPATREHSSFAAWMSNYGYEVTTIWRGSRGDKELTATWKYLSYIVSVTCNSLQGSVSGGGVFEYNKPATVTATTKEHFSFNGWYDKGVKVSDSLSYTFDVKSDITLEARFDAEETWGKAHGVIPEEFDSGFSYGLYPQDKVEDADLITQLNKLRYPDDRGYYFYNGEYYAKIETPSVNSGGENVFHDAGNVVNEWYLVSRIIWQKLSDVDGKCLLMSFNVLDGLRYSKNYEGCEYRKDYKGDSDYVYANNYKYSEVRTFLNTRFIEQAFFYDSTHIIETTVDNSRRSTKIPFMEYACENTIDKVFLLSRLDLENADYGFRSDMDRMCYQSKYALKLGVSNEYLMRSPYSFSSQVQSVSSSGSIGFCDVDISHRGVRPAITFIR